MTESSKESLYRRIQRQYGSDSGGHFYQTVMGDGGFDIHYGIYSGSRSMQEATRGSTESLFLIAQQLFSGQSVRSIVDFGSGRGGPAHWLAEQTQGVVTCVDLCESHHQQNLQRATEIGVDSQIETWLGSFESLPGSWAQRFDLAWAQETFCHASKLETTLSSAFRVLKPGGVLAFTDIMVSDHAGTSQAESFSGVNAVVKMVSPASYLGSLEAAGFAEIRFDDWTRHLEANFRAMLDQISGHRESLLCNDVPQQHLDDFVQSLKDRIEQAGQVLRWGAFTMRKPFVGD